MGTSPSPTAAPAPTRRDGLSTIAQGASLVFVGVAGLWLSFRFGNGAKAILGAGPLIGGGMVGYGVVHATLGERLRAVRWIVGVISGFVVLGATILFLETTLGVTFG